VVDGRLDEALLGAAGTFSDFTQVVPVVGGAASERTEVRNPLRRRQPQVAVRASTTIPGHHRQAMGRDRDNQSDDLVRLVLAPSRTGANGYEFDLTAAGGS